MTKKSKQTLTVREVISADKVQKAIHDMASHLMARFDFKKEDVAIVGIQTRGAVIANRIADDIRRQKNVALPVGVLDITLYRDDINTSGIQPVIAETHLDFDIDNKHIILIDDVLFTGRTIRAAMDEIMDFGRPKSIALLVLVDRGHRELPIAAEFVPFKIPTSREESVDLQLTETDNKEEIVICGPAQESPAL